MRFREMTERLRPLLRDALPNPKLSREIRAWRMKNLPNIWRGLWPVLVSEMGGVFGGNTAPIGVLRVKKGQLQYDENGEIVRDPLGQPILVDVQDYGIASFRVVTTVGVNFIVDAFQNSVEVENMKFHAIGTGTNAEAAGDTTLQTELTTQYNPNSTRATGTTTEGASANIYRTVGTNTPDAAVAITEHGIFDNATGGTGTLLDRSVFSAVNLNGTGDSLETTYELTFTAGG